MLRHDFFQDELRLFAIGAACDDAHRLAGAGVREERLAFAGDIVGDDAGGGIEDVAGRAIVLLQLDDGRTRKVALEVEDVVDVGTAEAIDRLVFIANRHDVACWSRQQFYQ